MYVAPATYPAPNAMPLAMARNGRSVGDEGDAGPRSNDTAHSPVAGRYLSIAYSFRADVERLIILYRDPLSGETVDQIPSEAALKQYENARTVEKRKSESTLGLVVGGRDEKTGETTQGAVQSTEEKAANRRAQAASGNQLDALPVPAAAPKGGGTARLNVVV